MRREQPSLQPAGPIGVFDSGLGGLSVLREINHLLPAEDLIYVADSAHAPYGNKPTAYIIERSLQLSRFLLSQGAKAIVVACNTATAYAIEALRAELSPLSIPVIGVEPAVKPAVRMTQSGVIAVLATEQTAQSQRLKRLIDQHAGEVKVLVQACPGLVEYVEQGDFGSESLRQLLQNYTAPLLEQGVDTLVLGCTHYPFLAATLRDITHNRMTILETSTAVTHQLTRVLEQQHLLRPAHHQAHTVFYSSKADAGHIAGLQALWPQALTPHLLPEPFRSATEPHHVPQFSLHR